MNDFSSLDYYGTEAQPQHAFKNKIDLLANGEYEFEITDAALDRINSDDVIRVGLKMQASAFEYIYWLNKQNAINAFLAEMLALGYPANTWGSGAGKVLLSNAIPACVKTLPGKRFRAAKTSRDDTRSTPPKTYHEIRIIGMAGSRSMPSGGAAGPVHAAQNSVPVGNESGIPF